MKVLLISVFPPDPAPEANHALHLSEQLSRAGHTVHVLCKKGSIPAREHGMVIHPIINDWSWADLTQLAKCIKSCRPDVVLLLYLGWVYNYEPMITFLPTVCEAVLPDVPCVTQLENIDTGVPNRSLWMRVLHKADILWNGRRSGHRWGTLLQGSSRIIVLSSPHKSRLLSQCQEVAEKVAILPPPPLIRFCNDDPAAVRKQVRESIGATETDFVLIYMGYIYPGKGVETLLRALRIVRRRNEKVRLVLVGGYLEIPDYSGSDYFRMLRQLPEALGIADRVTWTGHFNWDSDAGSRYLQAGDVFILPIDWGVTLNNSSLAAASTHGLPVIGTEPPDGLDEELEHGRNIYLCQPKNPEMLAEAIELIGENPDLRERLRLGVLDLARGRHSWDNYTKRLIGILESAVSSIRASKYSQSLCHVVPPRPEPQKAKKASGFCLGWQEDELAEVQAGSAHPPSSIWSEENATGNVPNPLVSVIVAAYNVEQYLSQCLDSLVNQTLKNIEIIVVNDASTDNSLTIMKEYQAKYPILRIINCKENLGLASVRNIGIRVARGQYVGFTDGDDWAHPYKYEWMYLRANQDEADIVFASNKMFLENAKRFASASDQHLWDSISHKLKQKVLHPTEESRVFEMEPAVWAKLYKRSFLNEHTLEFEEGMNSFEDVIFHFAVLGVANRISLLDKPVTFYRLKRPGQITGRTDQRLFDETIAVFSKASQMLASWNVPPNIWRGLISTELRFFNWLLSDARVGRIPIHRKREFFSACARHLQMIPERGFRDFATRASVNDFAKLLCMRRNWFVAYYILNKLGRPLSPLLYLMPHIRRGGLLRRGYERFSGMLHKPECVEEIKLRTLIRGSQRLNKSIAFVPPGQETLIETHRIDDQVFFLTYPRSRSGLGDKANRMTDDYYLTQTAVFREGDSAVDVGAHIGIVSIYLAKKYPFIKVYAIEPNPINYVCLERNIELNGVTNVVAINKAISGNGKIKTLHVDAWDTAWATIDARLASSRAFLRTGQVESVTLEQLFREYEIPYCRLLKMTAPGAIRESLQGFQRSGRIDLLCGEVDLEDCSKAQLEAVSQRIARQHFWRTVDRRVSGTVCSWLHQSPTGIDWQPVPNQD